MPDTLTLTARGAKGRVGANAMHLLDGSWVPFPDCPSGPQFYSLGNGNTWFVLMCSFVQSSSLNEVEGI